MARGPQARRDRRGRTRIGTRLALLLVVPLLGLIGMTAVQATTAVRQYREAAQLRQQAGMAVAANRLVDALQDERTVLAADAPTTPALRRGVADATRRLAATADATDGVDRRLLDRALGRVDAAARLAATSTGGIVAVDGYSPAVRALLRLSDGSLDPGDALDDGPATTADLLGAAEEAASRERGLLTALTSGAELGPAQFQQATELSAAQQILAERAASSAAPDLAARVDRVGDALRAADDSRQTLFFGDPTAEQVDFWMRAADHRVEVLRTLRDEATAGAVAAVDALAASSARTLVLSGLALLATILVSLLLVRGATRSIARPLSELAARAEEVALSRLPDAVRAQQEGGTGEVHLPRLRASGAAEVREVASAFNDVQDTALRLASEQAVLRRNQSDALTNLGRRNQTLLGRQLDFISDLEKRETDPAFLEHLFRLDHLASRMRRNAESLLILAGSETPRRRRQPAAVAEVVRAAMSEVEDFERVRLGQLGDATLAGPVVIDLVHLVAELVENALNFSPPQSTVEVEGRGLGQGGYQLAVIDHGVGMSDVELQAANQRMSGQEESDGVPTRYLGQYVIARLAAKTGALVRLQPTAGGRGVTAVVTVPAGAMVGGPDRSSVVAQPLPGTRAARELGPEPFAPGAGLVPQQPAEVVDPAADPYAEPAPVLAVDEAPAGGPDLPAFASAPSFVPEAPPPAPEAVPEQRGWEPVDAGAPAPAPPSAQVPAPPASAGSTLEDLLAPYSASTVPAPGTDPALPSVPMPTEEHPPLVPHDATVATGGGEGSGSSRLVRRVPGASLARSPLAGESAPAPTGERSADGVRSMLSAFQSGRERGRTGAPAEPQQGPQAPGWEESR